MRLVKWTDENGVVRQSYIKDDDPDEMAVYGILHEPPDLSVLNWDDIQKELQEKLIERGLITFADVQAGGKALTQVITTVMKNRILYLYRQKKDI